MINLVGLYGPSRSGKDESATVLVNDFEFEQRAQAAAIRKILLGLNPIIKDNDNESWWLKDLFKAYDEDWDKVKAASREATEYMIRLGQTCRDVIGYDVWLNTAIPSKFELENGSKIVISDIRQPNEYDAVRERGGQIWKLVKPGVEQRGMDGLLDDRHFDAIIYNDGTLRDLSDRIHIVMGEQQ